MSKIDILKRYYHYYGMKMFSEIILQKISIMIHG